MTHIERDTCIKNLLQKEYVSKYYSPQKGIIYGTTKLGFDMATMLYPLTSGSTLKILPKHHPKYVMQRNLITDGILVPVYNGTTYEDELMLTENGIQTITIIQQLLDEKYQKRQHQKETAIKVMRDIVKGMASIVNMSQKTAAILSKSNNSSSKKRRGRKYDYDYY